MVSESSNDIEPDAQPRFCSSSFFYSLRNKKRGSEVVTDTETLSPLSDADESTDDECISREKRIANGSSGVLVSQQWRCVP